MLLISNLKNALTEEILNSQIDSLLKMLDVLILKLRLINIALKAALNNVILLFM